MTLKQYDEKKLKKVTSAYFAKHSEDAEKPITVSGLACELGVKRVELLTAREGDIFYQIISAALSKIEAYAEERLFDGKGATGIIFSLRSNFGWADLEASKEEKPPDLSSLSLEELRRIGGLLD